MGFAFTKRVGKARNLTAAEVDTNFQNASDAMDALEVSGVVLAHDLETVDTDSALAADQGPVILAEVSVAQDAADVAAATAASAVTTANAATATALIADSTATAANATATSAALAVASKATLQSGALVASPTLAPNATAVQNAITTAVAGGGITTTSYSAVLLLDLPAGREMGAHTVTGAESYTIGAGPVLNGNVTWTLVMGSGAAIPTFAAGITLTGAPLTTDLGQNWEMAAIQRANGVVVNVTEGILQDTGAPTLTSASIPSGTNTQVNLVFSEAMNATWPAASYFSTASHTYTALTRDTGTTGHLTTSAAFTWQDSPTLAYTKGGTNNLKDLSSIELANFSGRSISNGLVMPVPGAPTSLTAGTPSSTTMPLTWVAPAVNGTQGTVSDYAIEYRTPAGSGSYSTFADGTGTVAATTVTGLTAATSYGFRVKATNVTGSGAYTSEVTATTASSTIFADIFDRTAGVVGNGWTSSGGTQSTHGTYLSFEGYTTAGTIYRDIGVTSYTADAVMLPIDNDDAASIYMRYVDDSHYVRASFISGTFLVQERNAGVFTTLFSGGSFPCGGPTYTLRVIVTPTTVEAKVDGVSQGGALSTTFQASSTLLGIYGGNNAGTYLYSVYVYP